MIRFADLNDLDNIVKIEDLSFQDGHYDSSQLKYELKENPFAKTLINIIDNNVVGFLIYMVTFNSATIVQIATDPKHRRKNIASSLLKEMENDLAKLGYGIIENITLEVRENNNTARSLYLKNGYKDVVVKNNYYSNGDNAVYMMKVLL